MKNRQTRCPQHQNTADQLCLYPECNYRLMCLLCEHNQHQIYSSIRKPMKINYDIFKKKVDKQIDRSIQLLGEQGNQNLNKQIKQVEHYYDKALEEITELINQKKSQNLKLLRTNQGGEMQILIKSRIQGKYAQLSPVLFQKIKQVYDGCDLQTMARKQRQQNLENAYKFMKNLHSALVDFLKNFNLILRTNLPEIRLPQAQSKNTYNYFQQQNSESSSNRKMKATQYLRNSQQQCNFQSIISDCLVNNKQILTTSYDKTLKIFNKNLKLIQNHQFENIIQKIQTLNHEQTYALAVSKQIKIVRLPKQSDYQLNSILTLRGHNEKINDLHSYNTRIIGSSSSQGMKIWDLYKQKCQYTLRDQNNPSCFNFIEASNVNIENKHNNSSKNLALGYHSHQIKLYALQNMKFCRCYEFGGLPLAINQQKRQNNLFYAIGFPHTLNLFDVRMPKAAIRSQFKEDDAVSCLSQSIFEKQNIYLGHRSGNVRLFDLRKQKTRIKWECHPQVTNLSKPNGVIRVFEQGSMEVLTVGCNDRKMIVWRLTNNN